MEDSIKKPLISQVSILYSIGAALFLLCPPLLRVFIKSPLVNGASVNFSRVTGMSLETTRYYLSGIVSELILVLLPSAIIIALFRYDFRKVLRLNRVSFLNLFLIFWIMIFALPAVGVLNLLNMWLVKLIFGTLSSVSVPEAGNWIGLLLGILVIGGSAGICEEIMFRGVIQRGFERFGVTKAILITSFLFGLIHRDFQKLFGTAALGALIGFLVYRSNSIYSGMFAHFTNNSIVVLIGYLYSKLGKVMDGSAGSGKDADQLFSSFSGLSDIQLIAVVVFWGIIVLGFSAALSGLIYAFIHSTSNRNGPVKKESPVQGAAGILWLVPGFIMIGFIYFVQGISLKGIKIGALEGIIKVLGLG